MKFFYYAFILINSLINQIIFTENTNETADALYFKAQNINDNVEKSAILSKAIKIANPETWSFYKDAIFKRASSNYKSDIEATIEDYNYLIKNFKTLYEPYLETAFIYYNRGQYKKSLKIIHNGLNYANSSIIINNEPSFITSEFYKLLFNELKLIIELINKDYKKAKTTFDKNFAGLNAIEHFEFNSIKHDIKKHIIINILHSFYYFSNKEYQKASYIIKENLNINWNNENSVITLSLFQKNLDFEDFYLNIKSDFSKVKWNQELSDKRKQWQKNKWQKLFRILNKKPLLL